MTKVALRGLLSRKLRSVLTGFAVVVGVAFVVGTLVFTDTINESFTNLFERTQKGVDVSIQAAQPIKVQFGIPPTMPADTLEKVKAVPGVEVAEGSVTYNFGSVLDNDGKPIVSNGPPTLLLSQGTEPVFQVLEYDAGGRAKTDDEVVIDRGTAKKFGWGVGDTVTIAGAAPAKQFKVSGVASLGDVDNLGGARFFVFTVPEAHRMAGYDGWDSISVSTGGKNQSEVKAAIQKLLGKDFEVQTGEEAAASQAADLSDSLGFIRIALLVFAGVALLVGGFLIFNTFTVTVAQRTKEFALLRVLGASRRQIMRSVLIETFAVGVVASIIGVLFGLVVAPLLAAILKSAGIDLGTTGMVIKVSTIIIGLVVGLVATMISGFIPARRATRVEPVTAMRDAVTPGIGHLRTRRIVGSIVLMVLGLAVMFYGLFGDASGSAAAGSIGVGAVLMMFGFAFLAPLLVQPLARFLGWPLAKWRGVTGRLARENAIRQPQRTAVTAAALMVGLALVVLVAVLAAGLSGSTDKAVEKYMPAALIVQNQDGFSPISAKIVDTVKGVPGVEQVSPRTAAFGQYKQDSSTWVNGIDPKTVNSVLRLKWNEGDDSTLSALTDDQAVINHAWVEAKKLEVGSKVTLATDAGKQVTYTIAGTFTPQAGLTSDFIVTNQSIADNYTLQGVQQILASGQDPDQIARDANKALKAFPQSEALTPTQFVQDLRDQINQLLGLVYGLLLLSIIVALLGIVNTLALSVHERTRELGMLRAVGMSRKQVRRMVRAESVITAGIGAILGIVLGIVFALVVSRPLASQGFTFILPVGTLIIFFILAGVAGVLAAIPPARRASRVDVLRAVTTE
jgi:putative ABC transport system permease protein